MLTERQEEVLDFVRDYQRTHGVAPSTREIARTFQCSQPTVLKHLQSLARKTQVDKIMVKMVLAAVLKPLDKIFNLAVSYPHNSSKYHVEYRHAEYKYGYGELNDPVCRVIAA